MGSSCGNKQHGIGPVPDPSPRDRRAFGSACRPMILEPAAGVLPGGRGGPHCLAHTLTRPPRCACTHLSRLCQLHRQSAERLMGWRVGVDSGGTFTDICLFDEGSGRIAVWKVSSTPADPSQAVAEGLGEALAQIGVHVSEVSFFGHGTTVATNALIQHRGAPTGLITSDG